MSSIERSVTRVVFTSSWDLGLKIITFAVTLLIGGVAVMAVRDIRKVSFSCDPVTFSVMSFAMLIGPVVYAICYFKHPRDYYVENSSLCVNQPLGAYVIPFKSIKSVSLLESSFHEEISRVCGVGGLFGYYGVYEHGKYGRFKMFATRSSNYVFVKTDDCNFVLTPDSPQDMLSYLKTQGLIVIEGVENKKS